jgi:hypothetical protein
MHGALDVASLGVWEAVGTPVEGAMRDKKYVVITATYDKTGHTISAALGAPNTVTPPSTPAAVKS